MDGADENSVLRLSTVQSKCKQVKVKFRKFSTNLFFFVCPLDFTILKCGPNLLKHIATHAAPPSLSPPRSSRRCLSPPRSSRCCLSPPRSSSRSLSPPRSSSRSLSPPRSSSRSLSPPRSSRCCLSPPRSSRCWLSLLCLEFTQKVKTMTGNQTVGGPQWLPLYWVGGEYYGSIYRYSHIDQNFPFGWTILLSSSLAEIYLYLYFCRCA